MTILNRDKGVAAIIKSSPFRRELSLIGRVINDVGGGVYTLDRLLTCKYCAKTVFYIWNLYFPHLTDFIYMDAIQNIHAY